MTAADWPLTGRDDELRRIIDAVRASGGVVLAGPAGVGKTRLAREAVTEAAGSQGAARWAVASTVAQRVPLGAFATFTGQALDAGADASLLAHAGAVLREGAPVVGVDDAHLLDMVSAALLHQLAAARAVRLVLTVRTDEPTLDAVTALWKDGLLERIELTAFTEAQTGAVLAAALGAPVEAHSVGRLFAVTEGNALWLRHLVDGELAAGRLSRSGGVWHWARGLELTPALTTLIEDRIGRLPDRGRQVLELLALGEPLDPEALAGLVDRASVEAVADRGLIVVEPRGRGWQVRLAHPLYGEAIRGRLDEPHARRLRGLLAEAAAGDDASARDVLRRAVLLVDSDRPADPDVLLAGAREAAAVHEVLVAERLTRAALRSGGGFEAQLLLAFLLFWSFRPVEAEREFGVAAGLAATDPQRIRVALIRALNIVGFIGRLDAAEAVLDAAQAVLADPAIGVELAAGRAMIAAYSNRLDEVAECGRAVLAAPDASDVAIAYLSWSLAVRAALGGWRPASDEMVQRAYDAATRAAETAPLVLNIGYWESLGLCYAGYPDRARAILDRFDGMSPLVRPVMALVASPIELISGRVATAATLCRDVRPYLPGHGGGWTEILEATLCQAAGMLGRVADASEALARIEAVHQEHLRATEPNITLSRAWVAAAEGAVSEAVELAETAARAAAESQQWAIEVNARHTAVCFGDPTQATRLTELATQVHGPRSDAAAAHATALATDDPAGLLAAADALQAAGLLLFAADATAQAASLHRRHGNAAESMTAAARAADLATRCEGARTPALAAALTPLPLTARAREVATLAHAGLSNRQIAARLNISVRTVEGHVYRACADLGVPDRATLAELVGRFS